MWSKVAYWYINLEDKAEEYGPTRQIHLPEKQAKEWLASLLHRSRDNKHLRRGKSRPGIDEDKAVLKEQ